MKILLDECLPVDFRHCFADHEAHTAEWAGLKGKQNGELIRAAQASGYDALVTVDQGLPRQQSVAKLDLSVVVIRSRTNQLEDLLPLVSEILQVLATIQPGQTVIVPQ